MKTIYVEHETDTAHRLSCHEGKCRNLHGHRYKFVLGFEVQGTIEDGDKFQDFYDIKQRVRRYLDERFDHTCVLKACEANDTLSQVLEILCESKLLMMDVEPTVEALVDMLRRDFPDAVEITIYETPTNYCTWKKEETQL